MFLFKLLYRNNLFLLILDAENFAVDRLGFKGFIRLADYYWLSIGKRDRSLGSRVLDKILVNGVLEGPSPTGTHDSRYLGIRLEAVYVLLGWL